MQYQNIHRAGSPGTGVFHFDLIDDVGFSIDQRPGVIGLITLGIFARFQLAAFTGNGILDRPLQLSLSQSPGREFNAVSEMADLDKGMD
ncbi:hypothetical protein D3C84_879840 [compost metagenome]